MTQTDASPRFSTDDEILDVVDCQNQVTGQASRREIHLNGWMHRSIHVFVLDRSGRLYIQKRSANKDTFAGAYDSAAAGHVEAGESYYDCAVRELQEELGLTAEQVSMVQVGELAPSEDNGNEHVRFYLARTDATPVPNPDEVESGAFYTLDQVEALIASPGTLFAPTFRMLFFFYTTELAMQIADGSLFDH